MRFILLALLALPIFPVAAADTDLCTPENFYLVTVSCFEHQYPDGTQRTTRVQVNAYHDAPIVPSFIVRVEFTQHGNYARCSVYYSRESGTVGPASIEYGTDLCVDPFYLP